MLSDISISHHLRVVESVGVIRRRVKELIEPLGPEHIAHLRGRPVDAQVRYLRIARRWSQKHLARLARVNAETVNRFELSGNVTLDKASRIITAVCRGDDPNFVPGSVEPHALDAFFLLHEGQYSGESITDVAPAPREPDTAAIDVLDEEERMLIDGWRAVQSREARNDVLKRVWKYKGKTASDLPRHLSDQRSTHGGADAAASGDRTRISALEDELQDLKARWDQVQDVARALARIAIPGEGTQAGSAEAQGDRVSRKAVR